VKRHTAKYAIHGDRTGFLRLDLNMREYVASGRGANILSSSISLDPEDDQACTLVVLEACKDTKVQQDESSFLTEIYVS